MQASIEIVSNLADHGYLARIGQQAFEFFWQALDKLRVIRMIILMLRMIKMIRMIILNGSGLLG